MKTCIRNKRRNVKHKVLVRISLMLSFLVLFVSACSKNEEGDDGIVPQLIELYGYANAIYVQSTDVGAVQYEVRYARNNDMSDASSMQITSTDSEIDGLASETLYYLQIRARNNSSWTAWSEVQSCKTASFSTVVTSINILGKSHDPSFPNNTWNSRKEALKDIVFQVNNNPDVLGIQEGSDLGQTMEVVNLLEEKYAVYVSDRQISARAIFWKPEKYSLIEAGEIEAYDGSVVGRENSRYVTFVHLQEKRSTKELLLFNIHPRSGATPDEQRVRGVVANVVSEAAKSMSEDRGDIPVVILGDFNNKPNTVLGGLPGTPQVFTSNGFTDTYIAAPRKINGHYSTHDDISYGTVTSALNGSGRIDYVFIYPHERINVSEYATIINFENNSTTVMQQPIPTDHRPVRAVIHLHY